MTGPRRITQRVLLLGATGNEPAYQAAKAALDRIGVPHQALIAANETVTAAMLSDGVSTCHFSAVIVATSSLGFWNAAAPSGGAWESALTAPEWQELADFEAACGARELVWYGWPGADFGLAPTGSFDSNATVTGTLTAAGQAQFDRVTDSAAIPYRHAWGYLATITDPATTTALVQTGGNVLVATHTLPDGRETMISTVDASPYLTHSIVLEYDFIKWVTRGVFVGKKRTYFAAQIDDLFLDNDTWSTTLHANDADALYRITGTDLTAFAAWQTQRQNTLPAGSTFITDMAFNGFGTDTEEYPDTTLFTAARTLGATFTWLNHTWDHENLDEATTAATRQEVLSNCVLATLRLPWGFSCSELVTPDMSGLTNPAAVQGLIEAGVRYVVSDTSITSALRPQNPGTNFSFNVGRNNPVDARLYQIARHPTSIYYDVATPEMEADEYNHIYRSYYGYDLTYEEILDKDSEFGLYYLLQGDIDPLMFHQANLHHYNAGSSGSPRSLHGDWVDAVINKYLAYSNAPIITLSQNAIGEAMKARGLFDACGATAQIVESATGRTLEITATNACSVPVTGIASPSLGDAFEIYAGTPTTSYTLAAGQTRSIAIP